MDRFQKLLELTQKHRKNITKKSFKQYYSELQLEHIKDRRLVEELMEGAIDSDCENIVKIIQNSYNILQVKEKERLEITGIMDEKTISAINNYKNPLELFVWINMNKFNYFKEKNTSDEFMKEWINDKVINTVKDYFKVEEK